MSQIRLPPVRTDNPLSNRSHSVKNLRLHNRLDESTRSQGQFFNAKSPFQLPSDEEVFMYVQMDKQKKDDNKRGILENKIWDKRTATSKNPLKHFKSFQGQINDRHIPKTSYKAEDKKMIQMAIDICAKRKQKQDFVQNRQPVIDMLEQKKEMFLVTMSHGIVQKEISDLKKATLERQQALEASKDMLKKDEIQFNQYVDKNKKEKVLAEKEADYVAAERKNLEQQYKQLNNEQISSIAENTRNEELVANLLEHKAFIDQLATQDYKIKQQKKKEQFLNDNFEDWLLKEKMLEQQKNQENEGKKQKKNKSENPNSYNEWREKKKKEYQEKARTEELDILARFEEQQEIHFMDKDNDDKGYQQQQKQKRNNQNSLRLQYDDKNPNSSDTEKQEEENYNITIEDTQKLVDHFDKMEKKNLEVLKEIQDIQEIYDLCLSDFNKNEQLKNSKINILKEEKEYLRKQIDDLENQIQIMKKQSDDNKNMINKEGQQLFNKIMSIQNILPNQDYKYNNPIEILTEVEQHIDEYLNQLKPISIQIVGPQRKNVDQERKAKIKSEKNKIIQAAMEKQKQKNLEKLNQKVQKRDGRKPMLRSMPLVKEQKVQETYINDEDEDNKYFEEKYDLMKY